MKTLNIASNGRKAVMLYRITKFANVKSFVAVDTEEVVFINRKGTLPSGLLNRTEVLDESNGFAVRSSGVDEDGRLSWAGQFESKLFVARKDLGTALVECAKAAKSGTASAYQKVHQTREPRLALFVQEMVDASVAGVIFTDNPANGDKDCMVIEATNGTADKLVSGQVEPRRWYVYKKTGLVKRVEGISDVYLSPGQISELVGTARRLNKKLGVNDVEWAFERGTCLLFVNQGRKSRSRTLAGQSKDQKLSSEVQDSIQTTIAEVAVEKKRLAALGCKVDDDVFTDQNIVELLTSFPTPMGFGLFTYCFAHADGAIRTARNELGYEIGDELERGFFVLVGGQPRSSIIHDAFTYRVAGIPLPDYCKLVNYYLARVRADRSLANYPEVVLYNQNPTRRFLADLFRVRKGERFHRAYEVFEKKLSDAAATTEKEYRESFLPKWTEAISRAKNSIGDGSLKELTSQYMGICELLRTSACRIFVKAARLGFFSYAQARKMIRKCYGKKADQFLNVLTGGSSRRRNPNLQFTEDLFKLKQGTVSLAEVSLRYGHLAQHELEISMPRFADQPETLRQLSQGITESPESDLASKEAERLGLLARLFRPGRKSLRGLSDLLAMAQTYLGLREEVKFEYLRGYALLRELAVAIERKLGWKEGRIFYLKPEEVGCLVGKTRVLRRKADEREVMHRLHKDLYVPPVSFVSELPHIGTAQAFVHATNVLKGIGVTNASVTGEVVVVGSLADKETVKLLKPGSILVTEQTDPAWAPALAIVGAKGGLITEVGGLLAHGAIYAREIGFAAVLNVPRATHVLKTGMRVKVDGASGKVTIISK
ncbi:MAG: hypothetical protein HYV67_00970 [Candidatus Taylorbacteria bacterium]|nr:hypothetical protein [Candidatus Taylorbacteria bacterium]